MRMSTNQAEREVYYAKVAATEELSLCGPRGSFRRC